MSCNRSDFRRVNYLDSHFIADNNHMKIVIIGNSGSGKSWLASWLAANSSVPAVHLDELYWQPGGFDNKRPLAETASLISTARETNGWVVEGVFGELAAQFLPDADILVWLDMDWPLCEARLLRRGSQSKAHMARSQSEAGLGKLLEWASNYRSRDDAQSRSGHHALVNAFGASKMRLESENDVNVFLSEFTPAAWRTTPTPQPPTTATHPPD